MGYTVTVDLYKMPDLDGKNYIKKFRSLEEQNEFFKNPDVSYQGSFNKFQEDLIIAKNYIDCIPYNYGRFLYHGKYFYFTVVDVKVINETKCAIQYDFDYYETARFQFNVKLKKGIVYRTSVDFKSIIRTPYEFDNKGIYSLSHISILDNKLDIIIYTWDSQNDKQHIYLLKNKNLYDMRFSNYYTILKTVNLVSSFDDIKGCYIIPDKCLNTKDLPNVGNDKTSLYEIKYELNLRNTEKIHITNDLKTTSFFDSRHVKIWECPKNYVIEDKEVTIDYHVDITATSCNVLVTLLNMPDESFSFTCDSVDVFNDQWMEYSYRQRQSDIDNRKISNKMNLANSLSSTGTSMLNGAFAGGASGVGGGIGAIGGVLSSLVGGVASYAINDYYGQKQQDVIDKNYKKALDNLLLQGSGYAQYYKVGFGFFNEENVSPDGKNLIEETIKTYGYVSNCYYSNIQEYVDYLNIHGGFTKLTSEIMGEIPDNWKSHIQARFEGGVTFV